MENITNWKTIYQLAADLYRLAPWNFLEESDVFAVQSPYTQKQYFVSIMGSNGVLPALAAYEGPEALALFWELENSETAEGSDILLIPHMILSFESEKDIDENQLKRFRKLSNDRLFTRKFPEVRRVIPGLFPLEPDDEALQEFISAPYP